MAKQLAVQSVFTALDKMTGPINKMGQHVDRFARQAQRSGLNVGAAWGRAQGLIRAGIAVLTTGAAAKAIVNFSTTGDEIAKTARMLGLSAQSLQELRFAADREGVSAENLTMAFRLLNNQTGQLQAGQGGLYSYLKLTNPQLALQAKNTRTTEDAFNLLIDAIGKEGNSAKRAALAQAAFGRSGQELIKLASVGAGGIAELRAEAQRLGLVMSDEAARSSEKMNDAITDLKGAMRGLTYSALVPLIQRLGPLIERAAQWIAANKELIGQRIDRFITRVVKAVETAVTIWRRWGPLIIAVGVAMFLLNRQMQIAMLVQALSKAFAVAAAVMQMFQAGASLATVAQWALNAAMDANPVGLVILALAALIGVMILLIKYQHEIIEALRQSWNWFNKLFNNPAVKLALYAFAMPLAFIASVIKTIVDLLQGEGWKSLLNMAGPWKALTDALGWSNKGGAIGPASWAGGSAGMGDLRAAQSGVSPNLGVISSNTTSTRRSVLDVNFANMPAGASARQKGLAPDINVRMFETLAEAGL